MTEKIKEEKVVDLQEVTAKKAKSVSKLTIAQLQKENKKMDAQGTAIINISGTDYELSYDKVFRKTKQRKVLEDTLLFFQEIGQDNVRNLDLATGYVSLLTIKYFTSIEVPDDISEALLLLETMMDLGVLGEIVAELPEDEVVKIFNLLTETLNLVKDNIEAAEKEAENIENEELLDGDREEREALERLAQSQSEEDTEVAEEDGE